MRKCLLFLLLLYSKTLFSQVNDNFNDGDFSDWLDDNSFFHVNSALQLQTKTADEAQTVSLTVQSTLSGNTEWEFYVQLDFDPSTQNQVRIYLISDKEDLKNALNGYFVQIGESGNTDSYDLYRQNGTTVTKIIDGQAKNRAGTGVKAKIRISRSASGNWELQTAIDNETAFTTEGTADDNTFTSSQYFGFWCKYTKTNSGRFIFDDVLIQSTAAADTEPPKITAAAVTDSVTLKVRFNEPLESLSAKAAASYSLNSNYGNPETVYPTDDPAVHLLKFNKAFETGNYILTVNDVKDLSGNSIAANSTTLFSYKKPYIAKKGDLIINEIFADPSPQIDLPGLEFIELYNASSETLYLKGWKYSDASSTAALSADSISSGEYLILSARADTNEFKTYGRVLGISPWPSLNNAGDVLTLISPENMVIDAISYTDKWYKSAEKKAGGWTLERISTKGFCSGIQNWAASEDISGGTPGRQNSVSTKENDEPLKLLSASLKDSITIVLKFNRPIDSLSAAVPERFSINNGVGNPVSASPISPLFNEVELKFSQKLGRGKYYQINAENLNDCSGVLIKQGSNTAGIFYPDKISKGDILISEVLFNPRSGGSDFVEIYNYSDNILDLSELAIAGMKGDSLVNIHKISAEQLLFKPKEYLVLSADPENIKKEYYTENPDGFIKMMKFPAYNNDAGTVVLLSDNVRIDQFYYVENMHFPLIKDPKGVSLERSSFSLNTNEPGNFRSAAASAGFATPGYKNSQYIEAVSEDEELQLASETFSPDNDGFEDAMQVLYHFKEPGMTANVSIYTDRGKLIRKLVKNQTLSSEGAFIWDGLNDLSEKASVGIYIIYCEVFDTKGQVKKFRKTCVLAVKFN